jgi:hypothetical protein
MYGLTIKGLIKCEGRTRALAAIAMAALIFLSALPTQTRAQGASANTYGGATVIYIGTIGVVPGQKVSVTVPNFYFQDGSLRFVKHAVEVTENESGLIYSGESGGINEAVHELGHVFAFTVPGDPSRGRVQLWIKVESFPPSPMQESAVMLPPTFELIDDLSGKTVVIGLLLPAIMKVRDRDGR